MNKLPKNAKGIPGFPGYYATPTGDIWSTNKNKAGKLMKPYKVKSGHLRVTLTKVGIPFYRFIHRLVLETYVSICPQGKECCHVDDCPNNNTLSNLYWGSRAQNLIDAYRNGKQCNKGEQHAQAKLKNLHVKAIRVLQNSKEFTAKEISYLFNVSHHHIRAIQYKRTWTHLGE
jgi:hypothetical protein